MAAYERALAINPDYADAWNNLGIVRQAQGDLAGSVAAYERALAINPDHAIVRRNLAAARKALPGWKGEGDESSAGMEEDAGAGEVRRRVESWINLPGVQLEIERRGGSFWFAEEVRSATGEERRYGGVLIRLKDAQVRSRSGLLFAQAALMRQLQAETAATPLKNLPWIELSSDVPQATKQLGEAQARRGLDLALFATPRDPRARQALADRVQRELSEAMPYPADPPRAILLGRAQVLQLHPLLLDYWTTAELNELPPVVILLLTDTIQDKAGNEYALAIWL